MRPAGLAGLLLAFLLTAGCTWFGGADVDADEEPDKSEYTGEGPGFVIVVNNSGADPFEVTVRVIGAGNADVGNITQTIAPGDGIEKWWSLERRDTYSARLNYKWTAAAGSSSQGLDEQVFDANDCPQLTRLAWDLRQVGNTVGHAFVGKTCMSAGDEA